MVKQSTILIDKELIETLKKERQYPRQTYNELIKELLKSFKKIKERNQYDKFIHKIQQQKMKEIWNNKEDEDWENV